VRGDRGLFTPDEVGEVWFEWWSEEDREELRALGTSSPDPFVKVYEEGAIEFATITPDGVAEWPDGPEADRETFARSPELAEVIADSMRRAVATGVDGWLDDPVASRARGGSASAISEFR
jgi:hypothetical protein